MVDTGALPSGFELLPPPPKPPRASRQLVDAMIEVESGGDPRAVSPAGAQGLMQLMPATAADLGVSDPFDPQENRRGGTRHLNRMLSRYGGDYDLALMAYNWGSGNLDRWLRGEEIDVPRETSDYLYKLRPAIQAELDRRAEPIERPIMTDAGPAGHRLAPDIAPDLAATVDPQKPQAPSEYVPVPGVIRPSLDDPRASRYAAIPGVIHPPLEDPRAPAVAQPVAMRQEAVVPGARQAPDGPPSPQAPPPAPPQLGAELPPGFELVEPALGADLPPGFELYEPEEGPSQLARGFKAGTFGTNPKMYGTAAKIIGRKLGIKALVDIGDEIAGYGEEELRDLEGRVGTLQDIRTDSLQGFVEDTLAYAGYQTGQGVASTIPSILAGAAGTVASGGNIVIGALSAALGGSYPQNLGDVGEGLQHELADELRSGEIDQDSVDDAALIAAIPMAALDLVGLGVLTKTFGRPAKTALRRGIIRRVARAVAAGATGEGITEAMQEAISQWTQAHMGKSDLATRERFFSVIENAVAGALTGGLFGVGGGVTSAVRGPEAASAPVEPEAPAARRPRAPRPTAAPQTPPGVPPSETPPEAEAVPEAPEAVPEPVAAAVPGEPAAAAPAPEAEAPEAVPETAAEMQAGKAATDASAQAVEAGHPAVGAQAEIVDEGEPIATGAITGYFQDEEGDLTVRLETGEGQAVEMPLGRGVELRAPAAPEIAEEIETAAAETAEPTPAQAEAGNYRKGRVSIQGLNVAIETPKGSMRRGVDRDGKPWEVEMPVHYGYIERTEGADGDQVDVFIGPEPESEQVYWIEQKEIETGKFDEDKVMLGFTNPTDARRAYAASFSDMRGPERIMQLTPLTMQQFREKLDRGDFRKTRRAEPEVAGGPRPEAVQADLLGGPEVSEREMVTRERVRQRLDEMRAEGLDDAEIRQEIDEQLEGMGEDETQTTREGRLLAAVKEQVEREAAPARPPMREEPSKPEEKAEVRPAPAPEAPKPAPEPEPKFEIGDQVKGKPGSGVEQMEGRVWHLKYEPGTGRQRLKVQQGSNLYFYASDFDLVAKAAPEPAPEAAPTRPKVIIRKTKISDEEKKPAAAEPEPPSVGQVSDKTAAGIRKLAENVSTWLSNTGEGDVLTWQQFTALANAAFAGTQGEGAYTIRHAYDALEMGVNEYLIRNEFSFDPTVPTAGGAKIRVNLIQDMVDRLPTQTRRTKEQVEFQQFSTPPTYAMIANWVAAIGKGEVVLEPSAGTGSLAVFAKNAGAEVVVNELAERRAQILRDLGFDPVFTENAEQLNAILPPDVKPTVVVMNPPFSQTAGRMADRKQIMTGARHIEQALARLEPGGRLVAIVGRGMGFDAAKFRGWWDKIRKANAVRANVAVPGTIYRKYGTAFDTRLLVIDKVAPDETAPVIGEAESLPDLIDKLSEVRHARDVERERAPAEPSRPEGAPEAEGTRRPGEPVPGAARPVGRGQPAERGRVEPVRGGQPRPEPVGEPAREGDERVREPRPGLAAAPEGPRPGRVEPERGVPEGPGGGPLTGELEVQARRETDLDETPFTDAIFAHYTPQRLEIPGAHPHPGKLMQSTAMAAVLPPEPTYQPSLDQKVIDEGMLSLPQLEAVVYAGQAHEQHLPAVEGVTPKRRGFFIGDAPGVGKGRMIAGVILDNWAKGRRRAVWVTKDDTKLLDAARRDFGNVGGDPKKVFKLPGAEEDIKPKEGVALLSFSKLARDEKRIDQLVRWLGEDFDGAIVFDEAHKMGNAIDMKGTRGIQKASAAAIAGLDLQERLPDARVLLASATGATEVKNLAYADRLGLWGRGTAFTDVHNFINDVSAGGVAAMELVARDMKALGMYVSRNLSYEDIQYERLEHELSPAQTAAYDRLADAWQVVLKNMNAALKLNSPTEGGKPDPRQKSAAMSAFWGAHQRFFNQILTSMQMPSVIEAMERDVAAGRSPVVQLVSTQEAAQNRALKKDGAMGNLEMLDLTPRDELFQMVERSFPVAQLEGYLDDDGNERTRPVVDSKGNPVENPTAVRLRDKLLEDLQEIRVPQGPLDLVISHFGHDKVAEVTGRSRRVVRKENPDTGEMETVVEKRTPTTNKKEIADFLGDKKQVIIFSEAGGTGVDYHASLDVKNQRLRRHYLAQAGWRADNAIQGLGRTHRSNQAQAPVYILVSTDISGHKRFLSSIARRLSQLGALTKGQRQATGGELFSERDNLENDYAKAALNQLIIDINRGNVEGLTMAEFQEQTGLQLVDDYGQLVMQKMPTIQRFLNRLLSMNIGRMNQTFDLFRERMDALVEIAEQTGTLNVGVETFRADGLRTMREEVVYVHPESGAETKYVEIEASHKTEPNTWARVEEHKPETWFKQEKTGRLVAVIGRRDRLKPDGTSDTVFRVMTPTRITYKNGAELYGGPYTQKVGSQDEIKAAWEEQVAKVPEFTKRPLHLITGVVLPIWDRLPGGTEHSKIYRLETDDGKRYLGRVISGGNIQHVLKSLGAFKKPELTPQQAVDAVMKQGKSLELSNGWTIQRRRVSGEWRMEISGLTGTRAERQALGNEGVVSETIQYRDRYFIPTGERAAEVMGNVTEFREIVGFAGEEIEDAGQRFAVAGHHPFERLAARDLMAVRQALHDALRQFAPGARGVLLPSIVHDPRVSPDALRASGMRRGRQVAGMYDPAADVIYLAYNVVRTPGEARPFAAHEAIHYLRRHNLFTPREWSILAEQARKSWIAEFRLPNEPTNESVIEEAVAYAVQAYVERKTLRSPNYSGPVDRIIRKVRAFLERLANMLRARGFQKLEDILDRFYRGDVGRRAFSPDMRRRAAIDDAVRIGADRDTAERAYEVARDDLETLRAGMREGIGDARLALTPDKLAETIRARAEAARGNLPLAPNVGVEAAEIERDLSPIKRPFYIPSSLFKDWPALGKAVDRWTRRHAAMQAAVKRVQLDWDKVIGGLSTDDVAALSIILFRGDSLGVEFTREDLRNFVHDDGEPVAISPKVEKAYSASRTLVEKLGNLVDQHERAMRNYLRRTIKPMLMRRIVRAARDPDNARSQIVKRYALRTQFRLGTGDPIDLGRRLDAIERQLGYERGAESDITAAVDQLDAVDAMLNRTSVQTRGGYVPHKFFGSWGVYRIVSEEDPETGEVYQRRELVADYAEHGFHPTQQTAVQAANRYAGEHPDEDLVVRPVGMRFAGAGGTELPGPAYRRIMENIATALEVDATEIREATRGVLRPRNKRRFAGFKQYRRGVEGYSKDLDKVMRAHMGEVVRFVYLDKIKYEAITIEERMALQEGTRRRPTLGKAWRSYVRDILGQKQPLEASMDELFEKPYMQPLHVGLGGGLTAFALAGGVSGNPFVGLMLGGWLGWRFYTARRKAGEMGGFHSRALTGEILSTTAHMKLGAFLNLWSSIVNLTQIFLNTASVLPYRHTMRGVGQAIKTLGGHTKYRRILDRHNIDPLFKHSEIQPHIYEKQSRLERYSLLAFDTVEKLNRSATFIAAYEQAMEGAAPGIDARPGPAQRYAMSLVNRTQFDYSNVMKPEALRNVFARVPLQFKNFVAQQIAFVAGLKSPKEVGKFLAHMFLVAGALGLPGLQLLDWLTEWFTGVKPSVEVKREALRMQARGELEGTIANALAHGLPSLVGVDISTRAGMGERFLPALQVNDLIGPLPSTILRARQLAENEAGFTDQLRNLSTGLGAPLKALESAANGMPIDVLLEEPGAFIEALRDTKVVVTNPRKKLRPEYRDEEMNEFDLFVMGTGGTPLSMTRLYDFNAVARHTDLELDKLQNRYMNRVANAYRRYMPRDPIAFREKLREIHGEAREEGLVIPPRSISTLIKSMKQDRALRRIKQLRRQQRPEMIDLSRGLRQ